MCVVREGCLLSYRIVSYCLSTCSHALVLFGGVQGLEYSLECDESLKADNVSDLCDLYLNLCPEQGSRTIRTEVTIPQTCLVIIVGFDHFSSSRRQY